MVTQDMQHRTDGMRFRIGGLVIPYWSEKQFSLRSSDYSIEFSNVAPNSFCRHLVGRGPASVRTIRFSQSRNPQGSTFVVLIPTGEISGHICVLQFTSNPVHEEHDIVFSTEIKGGGNDRSDSRQEVIVSSISNVVVGRFGVARHEGIHRTSVISSHMQSTILVFAPEHSYCNCEDLPSIRESDWNFDSFKLWESQVFSSREF